MLVERSSAVRSGVVVEAVTIVWMIIEAAVSIVAGVVARSVLLTAFGLDSVIELVSAGVLFWRLSVEARGGSLFHVERVERRAAWIVGLGLSLLCVYVVLVALAGFVARLHPESSIVGIAIAIVAVAGMPVLARQKRAIAKQLDSAALRGDAACSITCAYMAATLLIGLVFNMAFGWWWADGIAALCLLYWLVGEALEALAGARAGHGGCACNTASHGD
jgi:divalent metal cation (Fe/Co/Zn/Cd) transporter